VKRMYAPWRYTWIQESKDGVEECFLCDALEAPVERDRELLLLHRGGKGFIILNRYPYSNGHLMVAPNRHVSDLRELTEEEWREIGELTNLSLAILEKAIQPHGFNLGWNLGRVAGGGVGGTPASSCRPPLGGRHELHAGGRGEQGDQPGSVGIVRSVTPCLQTVDFRVTTKSELVTAVNDPGSPNLFFVPWDHRPVSLDSRLATK